MDNTIKIIGSILFIIVILTIGPWLFLWAVNTLAAAGGAVGFYIPFTFWTWLAAVLLSGFSIIPKVRRG